MTTALTGLAFLANGSTLSLGDYKENIIRIRDYLEKFETRLTPGRVGWAGGQAYCAALALEFFIHVYESDKKDKRSKESCEKIIDYLSCCVGDEEKMCKGYRKGRDNGTIWSGISCTTALANVVFISIGRARSAGFTVDDKVFQAAKKFYARVALKSGVFMYDQGGSPGTFQVGRSIAGLLAVKSLSNIPEDHYRLFYDYARKGINSIMTNHTPSLHMTYCAFTYHSLGQEDWKKYVEIYFEKLINRQQKDGSLEALWDKVSIVCDPSDLEWGKTYATAHFVLILQLPLRHVKFYAR